MHRLRWYDHVKTMVRQEGFNLGQPTGRRPMGHQRYRSQDVKHVDLSELEAEDWQ